ncbi:MAG: OmpA family protein, partial [Deltaproteobacteria bacterium]|nr:OmpA family protein [Deltaproteobacteria bacterium]
SFTNTLFLKLAFMRIASLLIAIILPAAAFAATPYGTVIPNTATATYDVGAFIGVTAPSNTVNVTTSIPNTAPTIELMRYTTSLLGDQQTLPVTAADYSTSGGQAGPFAALAAPVSSPAVVSPIDLTNPLQLADESVYQVSAPIFIKITDGDSNLNPAVAETVLVKLTTPAGDVEVIRLNETGVNTGVFTGYVQTASGAAVTGNGVLSASDGTVITAEYLDYDFGVAVGSVTANASLVDPYGVVFDSATGSRINGATVTLIDAATGLPAAVFGDDGISTFPSTLTAGGSATDSGGTVYGFQPGGYRFPQIAPGTYRLVVVPTTGFRAPSSAATSGIQKLMYAPYAILEDGSRGLDFTVNPGGAVRVDIPVDAVSMLYLTKSASRLVVAHGDFLQYSLALENTSSASYAGSVFLSDRLPVGFKYRKDSSRLNGSAAPDPSVSPDGRTLTYSLGDLAAGKKFEIKYVVEVAAGARLGAAVNYAVAAALTGISSNTAQAEVKVKEDLFGSKAIIAGRVSSGKCADQEDTAVAGARIYLEDGSYSVTDKEGKYHFEGLKPGTHIVQLDTVSVPEGFEPVLCAENSRIAGTPFSQFVDVQGGTLWSADFRIAPKKPVEINGVVDLELRSSLLPGNNAGIAGGVNKLGYTVTVNVDTVSLKNARLVVMLPDEASYIKGTFAFDGSPVADPEVADTVITYRLGDIGAGWKGVVTFGADIPDWGANGRITTKATIFFDGMDEKNKKTAVVDNALERGSLVKLSKNEEITLPPHFDEVSDELGDEDKKMLDGLVRSLKGLGVEKIVVVGHTDSTRINARNRAKFKDNYALSVARARSIARYLSPALGLAAEQVVVIGKGEDAPVAGNSSEAGRALNRRVGIHVIAHKNEIFYALKNVKDVSGVERIEVTQLEMPPSNAVLAYTLPVVEKKLMPEITAEWLAVAKPGLAWVWPHEGFNPLHPSLKVSIKHDPVKKLKVFLDGADVNPAAYEGIMKRDDAGVAVSFWSGVNIKEGDNKLEAIEYDGDGKETGRIGLMIHYSGSPVKAALMPEFSRLVADGKNPAALAIKLTDRFGYPVREGIVGEFMVEPPYVALQRIKDLQDDPLNATKSGKNRYTVGDGGIALIELEPTTQTGEAVVKLGLGAGEVEIRSWLAPEYREWILVGLAEGTAGYNTATGNMEALGESDTAENFYEDNRIAFFAKGKIKGEWLATIAYDSDKNKQKEGTLHQTIDPNAYYTLYGDASATRYDSASARSLYVKIEKDRFYALFGDMDTGLTVTELSRYSRSFNGFKSEFKGEMLDFNVFVSDTKQAFVKDEMQGDGTSGLYRLSKKNIVLNSESVTVETRDRFKSEVIITSRKMGRHMDYSIDYDAGTIFFKSPIMSRDENSNPIYVVVTYETFDSGESAYNYGGRGAARPFGDKFELGASHVHEGAQGGEGDLYGADASLKLTDKTTVKAEAAQTSTGRYGVETSGSAYKAELLHRSEKLEGKAYLREQEAGFGLGQQNGSETGTRKYGFDAAYKLDVPVTLKGQGYRQENLATGALRDMAEAEARYAQTKYDLGAGLRHAKDSFTNGVERSSEQAFAAAGYRLLDGDLAFSLRRDQSIGSNANADFPTRTAIGSDYKISGSASLYVLHEITEGEREDSTASRFGIKAAPWSGAQINTGIGQTERPDGTRVFSTAGLKQAVHLTERWTLDAGYDRSDTLKHPGNDRVNSNAAPASGGADFTAMSAGLGYKAAAWSWTGRAERRDSKTEDKTALLTAVSGEPAAGLGVSLGVRTFKSDYAAGNKNMNTDVRVGLAYRPQRSALIVLDKYDYIKEQRQSAAFNYDTWRMVNNLNLNYKLDVKTQIAFQYGGKLVADFIDGTEYRGYTDLTGLEARYDVTKEWDLGLRTSVLHSWTAQQLKHGTGASVGYNVAKNIWLSVGYNLTGFSDRDFSKGDFLAKGPFVKFRMKFDQATAQEAVKWFAGQ